MSKTAATASWREARRQSARDAIVDAAWELAREEGLAGFNIRDLAKRAGITTPTIYAYFDSKHAIYDAMFGRAATDFADRMEEPFDGATPRDNLVARARRFIDFCTSDPVRYQLLFQRTIPGFEPSAESYAPAVRALETSRRRLAAAGIEEPESLDMWTALLTGLVAQQISNEPGGTRWISLVDRAIDMFLTYMKTPKGKRHADQG